jgi:hypothetical protein
MPQLVAEKRGTKKDGGAQHDGGRLSNYVLIGQFCPQMLPMSRMHLAGNGP